MENKRNSGIELLRIILTLMICTLHVLNHGGIFDGSKGTNNYLPVMFIESLCYCAVDGYALISGFFAKDKPINYKRILYIWFAALFYSFGITLIIWAFKIEPITWDNVVGSLFPVTFGGNWYFSSYFAIFFLTPFINKSIDNFTKQESEILFYVLFIVFSLKASVIDNWYLADGYSAFWLFILCAMGALLRKSELLDNKKPFTLFISYLIFSISTFLLNASYKPLTINTFDSYMTPTVVGAAIVLVVMFSKIQVNSKIINTVAPLTLGIYLFHENKYIKELFISKKFTFVAELNPLMCVLAILIISIMVFVTSGIVEYIRIRLFKALNIDKLCLKIERKIKHEY